MRVEEKFQSCRASQSLSSVAGATMSPNILIESFIEPIQSAGEEVEGGTISATGSPNRVISKGVLVFWTSSSMARHFALNSEMATLFMTTILDHSPNKWSTRNLFRQGQKKRYGSLCNTASTR